jgi:hypothetical protein
MSSRFSTVCKIRMRRLKCAKSKVYVYADLYGKNAIALPAVKPA